VVSAVCHLQTSLVLYSLFSLPSSPIPYSSVPPCSSHSISLFIPLFISTLSFRSFLFIHLPLLSSRLFPFFPFPFPLCSAFSFSFASSPFSFPSFLFLLSLLPKPNSGYVAILPILQRTDDAYGFYSSTLNSWLSYLRQYSFVGVWIGFRRSFWHA